MIIQKLLSSKNSSFYIIAFITAFAFLLRIYQLDNLPAEMWGDVIEHYKLAKGIQEGHLFLDYKFGGDGPLFSYVVFFVSRFLGLSFYSIKFTTALIGTILIPLIYFLAKELFGRKEIGYISSFLAAVSFWSLSFSRQAKPHILVPVFVCLTILFALKKRKFLSGFFLGLGMYTQAGFWGASFFAFLNVLTFFLFLMISFPLISSFSSHQNAYFSANSFFGEKLGVSSHFSFLDVASRLIYNLGKNLLSFNVTGDIVFRHTITGQPHLDFLSGIFFLLGFLIYKSILTERNEKLFLYFLLPFFMIQIPSILDIKNSLSAPNMGRMIGITPFAYMGIAYGLFETTYWVSGRFSFKTGSKKFIQSLFICTVLIIIFCINFYKYFYVYPKGLPNGNVPFGKIIASKIDSYSQNTGIVIVGCCWGEWGQPEPNGIVFLLKQERNIHFIFPSQDKILLTCDDFRKYNAETIFIVNPQRYDIAQTIEVCLNKQTSALEIEKWKIAFIVKN